MATKTDKVIEFLRHLQINGTFCTKELAQKLGRSERMIQKYKRYIEERFGIEFKQIERGCYAVPNQLQLEKLLPDKRLYEEYEKFIDILQFTNSRFIELLDIDPEKLVDRNNQIYFFMESPFEEFYKSNFLPRIKKAIEHRKVVHITYEHAHKYRYENAKPLRIVFAENNWYLAILSQESYDGGFRLLRINFITSFEETSKRFRTPKAVNRYFENFQSLFTNYESDFFEVDVIVSKEVAHHFQVKKFLPSQKIVERLDDGSLKIRYRVNNEDEILLLAKRWLPDMKVLDLSIDAQLKELARRYLS